MNAISELARLLADGDGVILVRENPHLKDVLRRQSAQGRVRAVLPGVYVPADLISNPWVTMQAVAKWDPDAVLTGAAAARLTFWPEIKLPRVDVAVRSQRRPQAGFAFHRRRIPLELVGTHRGLRVAKPSLTALDLSDVDHTDAIDTALRTRAVTLQSLHEALRLTPHRPGNTDVRRLLVDSRDEPWSRAERQAHRLLRCGHITGWKTNLPFWDLGSLYYIDIAFESLKLAIEIDGRFHEDDPRCSRPTAGGRTPWCSTAGGSFGSLGPCCGTTPSSSCRRFVARCERAKVITR